MLTGVARIIEIPLLFLLLCPVYQVSSQNTGFKLMERLEKPASVGVDSIGHKTYSNIDSVQQKVQAADRFGIQATSATAFQRIGETADSVKRRAAFDSLSARWYFMTDSLAALGLTGQKYSQLLDSLGHAFHSKNRDLFIEFQNKVQSPFAEMNTFIADAAPAGIISARLPILNRWSALNIPTRNAFGGGHAGLSEIQGRVANFSSLPDKHFKRIQTDVVDQDVMSNLTDLRQVTARAQAYSRGKHQIAHVDTIRLDELSKELELQALKIEEVGEFQKQAEGLGEYQLLTQLNDPDSFKELAKQELLETAPDHFADQHQALQSAMSVLADAKKNHSSLASLNELRKRNRFLVNSLKGRPFEERFRPGMMLQAMSGRDALYLHTFPTTSYKLTGAVAVGVGGYYRVVALKNDWKFAQRDAWWGFIAYTTVRFMKSLHFRLEADAVNSVRRLTAEHPGRDWEIRYLGGIQKEFRLSSRLTGSMLFLHSFENQITGTLPEKLNLRAGIEYSLVSRKD
jgi:hypothetical protein